MEDYGSLVDGLRRKSKFFDQMVGRNETSILFENSILAIETLVAENNQLRDDLEGYGTHGAIAYAQTELRRQSAGRIEALKERNKALEALAESRARFGDSEARRAELEAVISEVQQWRAWAIREFKIAGLERGTVTGNKLDGILAGSPSVVLADRDREVAAREHESIAYDIDNGVVEYGDLRPWTDGSINQAFDASIRKGDTNA